MRESRTSGSVERRNLRKLRLLDPGTNKNYILARLLNQTPLIVEIKDFANLICIGRI